MAASVWLGLAAVVFSPGGRLDAAGPGGTVEGHSPFVSVNSGVTNLSASARISYLDVYNSATVNSLGATVSWANLYGDSSVNVHRGSQISWLLLHDRASAAIHGGTISWVKLFDASQAHFRSAADISWVLLNRQAQAHFYGRTFQYSRGILSGVWLDGRSFSLWAVNEADLHAGNISSTMPSGLRLHIVPEPAGAALAAGAAAALWRSGRRRRKCTPRVSG
ncbi:MAG: hypothetical protein DCC67_01035 [Planctomycetota bacterium]|nr:MAG: hypothetical protein DCC67_01035 [Planctomycetota bacterium]